MVANNLSDQFRLLCSKLGYDFHDPRLLKQALTHRSYSKDHNERLEFLGDAVLGLIIGELLYEKFPEADEGQLSRCRSRLVKGETLALLAQQLKVEPYILLGAGEKKYRQSSIMANVFEAIIGAIYMDTQQDISIIRNILRKLYQSYTSQLDIANMEKDPKTSLQELCQAKQLALPEYHLIKAEGRAHERTFTISCITGLTEQVATAKADSIKKAEQKAARQLLDLLKQSMF